MTDQHYILKNKEIIPVDLLEWAKWFESTDRHVGLDYIGDDNIEVSTVFLGLDHNWGEGKPLLFETMVFGGKNNDYQERYSTYEQAEAGHKKIVEAVKNNQSL